MSHQGYEPTVGGILDHSSGFLLKAGAPVTAADKNGDTPLHAAADLGQTAAAAILLAAGAPASAKNGEGRTPLHAATADRSADVLEVLLAAGAAVSAADGQGCTARWHRCTQP